MEAESRLNIRATPTQKQLLARAARARHQNVSQFVLQTSLDAAERIVGERESIPLIAVSDADYDWLLRRMEEPAADLPELKRLMSEPANWNG